MNIPFIAGFIDKANKVNKNPKQRKRAIRGGGLIIGAFLCMSVYSWLFTPYQGGMDFGVCKVFLELNTQYPDSLRLSRVNSFKNSVRISYSQLDSFGQYKMETIQCYYRPDPISGSALSKVTVDRREIDPQILARFNKSIPTIISFPPDLTYPRDFPDSLKELWVED